MAIAVAQIKTLAYNAGVTNSGTFDSNVGANSALVNMIWKRNIGTINAPDGSWTKLGEENNNGSGDDGSFALFYKFSGAGGFSATGAWAWAVGDPGRMTLFEITGVVISGAYAANTKSNTAATNHPVLTAISGPTTGGIVVAGIDYASGFGETFTPDSGYTLASQGETGSTPAAPTGCTLYQIGTASSYTPGATATLGGKRYCGGSVVFAADLGRTSIIVS